MLWVDSTFEIHNITLSIFPWKIPETRKIFFKFSVWPPPNIAPNPTDQSRSIPLSRVLLQIFLGVFFFVFDQPSQLWVILFKNLNFDFLKNGFEVFHHICWVCRHSTQQFDTMGFYRKISWRWKKNNCLYFAWGAILNTEVIFCSLKSNCNHKVLIMEVTSKLIQRFSSYNKRNKLTNWVTMFWNFTYNIHCFCCYVNESADSQKCIVISQRKTTAYKNKSLSNYDIEH